MDTLRIMQRFHHLLLFPLQMEQCLRISSGHGGNISGGEPCLGIEAQRIRIGHRKGVISTQQEMVATHHGAQELQRRGMVHNRVVVKTPQVR